nr:hypothetical protein [Tanacetum cinerariifolium]
ISLGVTSEERANPQLSSDFTTEVDPGLSAPNDSIPQQQGIDKGTKNTSCDHISADFTTEVDPGLSAPNDSIPQQQGIDKGTKNTSYDHISAAEYNIWGATS